MTWVPRHRLPPVRLLLAVLLLAFPSVLRAQELPALEPGTRVRLLAPGVSPVPVVGEVVRNERDTMVLVHRGVQTVVPTAAVRSAEVSWDRRGARHVALQTGKGALIGAALGVGYVLVNSDEPGGGTMAVIAGATAAGVGGGIGLLVGVAGAGERWRPVPVVRESGRSPSAPGLALGMRVTL